MNTSAQAYDLIVLDFDGTIADTRPAAAATFGVMFPGSRDGPALASMLKAACSGIPLEDTLLGLTAELNIAAGADRVQSLAADYRRLYPAVAARGSKPFADAELVIRNLLAGGLTLAIASNKGEAAIMSFLADLGLNDCFAVVLGDVPDRPRKPDRALLLDFLLPHVPGAEASRTLVVGDTETDLAFADNCGAASCWARFGYGDKDVCAGMAPDFTIDSWVELARLLLTPEGTVELGAGAVLRLPG